MTVSSFVACNSEAIGRQGCFHNLQALSRSRGIFLARTFSKLVEAFKACLDSFTNGSTWPAQSNLKENRFKTISRPRLVLLLIAHAATLAENGIMLRGSAVGDYLYLYLYLYLHLSLYLHLYLYLHIYLSISIYIHIYYRYICIYIYTHHTYIYIHTHV